MNILNESIFDVMVFCVVVGCTNHSNKKGEKFSCFHLPGHAHLRNVWLAKLKRENLPNERSIPFTKPCIDPPGKLFICCIAIWPNKESISQNFKMSISQNKQIKFFIKILFSCLKSRLPRNHPLFRAAQPKRFSIQSHLCKEAWILLPCSRSNYLNNINI